MKDNCKTGIYYILNKINNKFYIGSTSVAFNHRWDVHKRTLNKNKHHSVHLQRAWDKYGEENFEFKILEYIPKEEYVDNLYLTDLEQIYLDTYQPEYNIRKFTRSPLGLKHTDETKKKISMAGKGRKHKPETIEKMKNVNKGVKHYLYGKQRSKEIKEKISLKLKGRKLPEDTVIKFKNKKLTDETKHKISLKTSGELNPFYGKTHSEETLRKMIDTRIKNNNMYKYNYKFLSPNGDLIETKSLTTLCKENNLDNSCLRKVANGKLNQHKGWVCISKESIKKEL